ncbi:hypothetical protein V8C44DRAFT_352154 [Trichoderma aethiopicum]
MIIAALSICRRRISAAHGFASVHFTSVQSGCAWLQSCKEPKDKPTFEIQVPVQPSKGKKPAQAHQDRLPAPAAVPLNQPECPQSGTSIRPRTKSGCRLPPSLSAFGLRYTPADSLVPACRKSLDKPAARTMHGDETDESQIAGGVAEFAQG